MDPVFTLQWPEFIVCEHLQKLCPKKEGYSFYSRISTRKRCRYSSLTPLPIGEPNLLCEGTRY